ncbi:MAG: hypothetical protein FIO03_06765 [Nitrosopumilales archaeon]|nr:hypothetical protein [Nitrosopumilales archaeon]
MKNAPDKTEEATLQIIDNVCGELPRGTFKSYESASMNSDLMPFVTTLGYGFLDGLWGYALKPALSTYNSSI